jgi:hypothetical protein
VVLPLSISCEESRLLVSCCTGDRCDMAGSDEDRDRSRRLGAEDRRLSSIGQVLGGQTIEGSGDAVYGVHHSQGDEERGFLGLASKPTSTVSPSLASKLVSSGFPVWVSKPAATIW